MSEARGSRTVALEVMGIPVQFEADDEELLRAAVEPYARWWGGGKGAGERPVRVRLSRAAEAAAGEPAVRVSGSWLALDGPALRGGADAVRREAWCTVPPALATDPDRLAAEVVDTLLLFLLTRAGRMPLHAAGVMVEGVAVLLTGPSGVGKSTLALAAQRVGLPVLSDDTVYVQLRPRLRVWGFPRPIHLLPDAELSGDERGVLRMRGGRWKLAIAPRDGWRGAPMAERAVLCLLERGTEPRARAIGPEEAVEGIVSGLEPGFDHFRDQMPGVVKALAAGGAWRLSLSPDPAECLAALRSVLMEAEVSRPSASR